MGIFRKNGTYFIDYYVRGKRRREKIGSNRRLAENVLHKRKTEIAENRYLDIKKDEKIKFRDFAGIYLENHAKVNKRSWASTDIHYIKKLNEFFGDKLLYEISSMDIEKFKAQRIKEVSCAYVNRELTCLKCIFNKAIQWKKFYQPNPMLGVKLYKENNQRVRYLERQEIFQLLDECEGELKSIVLVALNTGMRRGEIMDLKWEDADIQNGLIYVRKSKSGESRITPMNGVVKETFFSLSVRRPSENSDASYIFDRRHREGFENACKRAGIKNFRFHDLRHTFASHLVMMGRDLNTVRELLGHKSLAMTLRYTHLSPNHKLDAVKMMDTFWTPRASEPEPQYSQLVDR